MAMDRRTAMKILGAAVPAWMTTRAVSAAPQLGVPSIAPGPFHGTFDSLQAYRVPDWFGEAKFGIWAHWGPQSAAEQGDWYARNIYMQGSKQNLYHVEHYGHPSKFGHKDIVNTWTASQFDPDHLMGLYKKAGAKYFVSMGVHHDNFDLWDSKYQHWNAAKMGPKKDIVGMWRKAAHDHGLKFGVSDHLWISYKWFSTSHMSDKDGPMAGVPYDGADPRWFDLYHDYRPTGQVPSANPDWNENGIPEEWKQQWFLRIKDLVDNYHPDLLYNDGPLPFEQWGFNLVAHLYNTSAARNGGVVDAVYNSKRIEDCQTGVCALDIERGVVDSIWHDPWQTDTCIGNWHYLKGATYKTPKRVIDMLADIVSRNGNLLLNFPLPNVGMLDDDELAVLDGITRWMAVNSEAIYATRPWKIYGSGPSTQPSVPVNDGTTGRSQSSFNERNRMDLTAEDCRFTTKGKDLFAFVMGWPEKEAVIPALGSHGTYVAGKVENVELLGFPGKVTWSQDDAGLHVQLPAEKPSDYASVFRVTGVLG